MKHKREGAGELHTFYKVRRNDNAAMPKYQVCAIVLRKTSANTWLFIEGDSALVGYKRRLTETEVVTHNFHGLGKTMEDAVARYNHWLRWKLESAQLDVARAQEYLQQYEQAMNTEGAIHGRTNEADTHPPYRRIQQRAGGEAGVG